MGLHSAVRVRWAGDRCSVCDSDVDYDFDQLVSCDACGITVHQSCYGVPEAPGAHVLYVFTPPLSHSMDRMCCSSRGCHGMCGGGS